MNGQYLCYLKLNYSGVDRRSIDVYPDDDVDQLSLSYHYPTVSVTVGNWDTRFGEKNESHHLIEHVSCWNGDINCFR